MRDLLVIDEAHSVVPSGRSAYIRDSDRTVTARQILSHFEHRLFLTATPLNGFPFAHGYGEQYTAPSLQLLEGATGDFSELILACACGKKSTLVTATTPPSRAATLAEVVCAAVRTVVVQRLSLPAPSRLRLSPTPEPS